MKFNGIIFFKRKPRFFAAEKKINRKNNKGKLSIVERDFHISIEMLSIDLFFRKILLNLGKKLQ